MYICGVCVFYCFLMHATGGEGQRMEGGGGGNFRAHTKALKAPSSKHFILNLHNRALDREIIESSYFKGKSL